MTLRRALGALCLSLAVLAASQAQPPATDRPASGTESLDLHGPPDTTPLNGEEQNATPFVSSPPQTVEGTVSAIDADGTWIEVVTRNGAVKIGLPANVPYLRNGKRDGSLSDVKPGDSIYATVVTQNGPRAVYVVTDSPYNPWITWLGVPALLLVAAWIWQTGRSKPVPAPSAANAVEPAP